MLNGGKWRLSLRLRDLSEPVGVLISTEKGVSEIGKAPGFAMAASEETGIPGPSVEEPEGADMPTKENVTIRLITCFTGKSTNMQQQLAPVFLSQCNTVV